MSSSFTERSQTSLSASASQTHPQDISLEALVSHLLASKRSLSSISTVWRANEIVTSARESLEESVKLSARTGFLRAGIAEQANLLRKVRRGVDDIYKEGQKDFKAVLRTLDDANSRLESTMNVLRSTMVEAAFRPEAEDPRSLLDFVDEQGVETMRDALRRSIRESREAQTSFDSSMMSFDNDYHALKSAITASPTLTTSQFNDSLSHSPIPEHLQVLETNAQEMAALLDSLVSHFDLCVNAIRHTEGGYAAVRKAASHQPPDVEPVSVSGVMGTSQHTGEEEAVNEEERREMLAVLQTDASQVEDVVAELSEHLADMESIYLSITDHVSNLSSTYDSTISAFTILEALSAHLPGYLMAASDFTMQWEDTKSGIQEQLDELEAMRIFYENYHASYDGLILEVFRRKQAEEKVKALIKKTMDQIEKIRQADSVQREAFRVDVEDFMPGDLWGGVGVTAPKWDLVQTCADAANSKTFVGSTPELSRSVVEAAGKRDRDRQ
ncbi:autophagy-related protein 17, partial [Calycina marina]